MRRHSPLALLVLAGLLAACGPVAADFATATSEPPTPTPEIFMPVPEEMRAEVAAREALAEHLNVPMAEITTRQVEKTVWPDNCLGLALVERACQAGDVPGYRVVLETAGVAYEVRTDAGALTVLVAGQVDAALGELPAPEDREGAKAGASITSGRDQWRPRRLFRLGLS